MKFTFRLAFVALLVASVGLVRAEGPKDKPETELGERMEDMRNAFRKLHKEAGDPTKGEESLRLAGEVKRAALAASKLTPALAAEVPEAKRKAFIADFHDDMLEFVGVVEKLEVALKEKKFEEAKKLVERMVNLSRKGHKEFKKPEEKEGKEHH